MMPSQPIPTTLDFLKKGQRAIISSLEISGPIRRRLLDLGFVAQNTVEYLGCSPSGDPRAYRIQEAVIALRRQDSTHIHIYVTPTPEEEKPWD